MTRRRALLAAWVAVCAGLAPRAASADSAPPHLRSDGYYVLHGSLAAALLSGSLLIRYAIAETHAGPDPIWFPGDVGLRKRCSRAAAALSDATLSLSVLLPVAAQLGTGSGARFLNAEIVYSQSLLVTALANTASKAFFRRPRPYSYSNPDDCGFLLDRADANVSFYSGHASVAFAAAITGSYVFAENAPDDGSRWGIWGGELAFAAATANLRVRAGKHYYSDVVVGTLLGAFIGIGVPLLHGADRVLTPGEFAAAGGGIALGIGASLLVPVEPGPRITRWLPRPHPHLPGVALSGDW